MRLPRFRFTVRRMMVAVAIAAACLSIILVADRYLYGVRGHGYLKVEVEVISFSGREPTGLSSVVFWHGGFDPATLPDNEYKDAERDDRGRLVVQLRTGFAQYGRIRPETHYSQERPIVLRIDLDDGSREYVPATIADRQRSLVIVIE